MTPDQPDGEHVELPAYLLTVRLNKGRTREIDLRIVAKVERSFAARESWVFWHCGADPLQIHYSEFERVQRAWQVWQERRAQNETIEEVKNIEDQGKSFVELDSFGVYSWHRERDAKGKPEQVHLSMDVRVAGVPFTLVKRFRTPGAVNAVVDALVKHREDVWPTV